MEYRTLGLDEVIQDGDEFFGTCGRWRPVSLSIGCMVRHAKMHIINTKFRRPLSNNVGPSYRLLDDNEFIKDGDEVLSGSKWLKSLSIGLTVRSQRDGMPQLKYRRKINDTSGAVVAATIPVDICVLCKANPLRNCPPCREIRQAVSANPTRLNPRRHQPSEPDIVVRKGWDNVTRNGQIAYLYINNYLLCCSSNDSREQILEKMKRVEESTNDPLLCGSMLQKRSF